MYNYTYRANRRRGQLKEGEGQLFAFQLSELITYEPAINTAKLAKFHSHLLPLTNGGSLINPPSSSPDPVLPGINEALARSSSLLLLLPPSAVQTSLLACRQCFAIESPRRPKSPAGAQENIPQDILSIGATSSPPPFAHLPPTISPPLSLSLSHALSLPDRAFDFNFGV
jgi:hypothetical protein